MGKTQANSIREMIEQKGLDNKTIITKKNNVKFGMEMESLLESIESSSPIAQDIIFRKMVEIDSKNGNIMPFMKQLAKQYTVDLFNLRSH